MGKSFGGDSTAGPGVAPTDQTVRLRGSNCMSASRQPGKIMGKLCEVALPKGANEVCCVPLITAVKLFGKGICGGSIWACAHDRKTLGSLCIPVGVSTSKKSYGMLSSSGIQYPARELDCFAKAASFCSSEWLCAAPSCSTGPRSGRYDGARGNRPAHEPRCSPDTQRAS